jgi:hypothetical protein
MNQVAILRMEENMEGMISKDDLEQVYEETVMSVIDGLALYAVKSKNKNFLSIMLTWSKYYWRKYGGDEIQRIN